MDWDELRPKAAKTSAAIGDNLESLSIAELEARINAFEAEIVRTLAELDKKRAHEEAAAALFKKT
ncbi:MAG: DUF1192 domain-containing protein [Hyphomicrobium sp.]|jgi:uncharacterized small protein (DUF1192 family)